MITKRVVIKGEVQGVFYRASAKKIANNIGITGWVKNNTNGDVEAKVSGTAEQLSEFINWCKEGPPDAEVKEMLVTDEPVEFFSGFNILR